MSTKRKPSKAKVQATAMPAENQNTGNEIDFVDQYTCFFVHCTVKKETREYNLTSSDKTTILDLSTVRNILHELMVNKMAL